MKSPENIDIVDHVPGISSSEISKYQTDIENNVLTPSGKGEVLASMILARVPEDIRGKIIKESLATDKSILLLLEEALCQKYQAA
ncbi:hypothetical protein GSS88_10370 [Corynebacterium sp. 3HC-13]|uniref:hypothetical protein n=1 Tax=Corynebacterium poyangense TaxID=2684405 RepID=UPI001CCA60BF|nr:hypothetical protein [Corynebacterium poyangense]MBZ8178187.1 hypothetical protein [Corynebacterium poyangense]